MWCVYTARDQTRAAVVGARKQRPVPEFKYSRPPRLENRIDPPSPRPFPPSVKPHLATSPLGPRFALRRRSLSAISSYTGRLLYSAARLSCRLARRALRYKYLPIISRHTGQYHTSVRCGAAPPRSFPSTPLRPPRPKRIPAPIAFHRATARRPR